MHDVEYRVVEHDGGWAYKLGDVFSETFDSRAAAETAAERAAAEQRLPGEEEAISWQDEDGRWHDEIEHGNARPDARVSYAGDRSSHDEEDDRSFGQSAKDYVRGAYDRGDEYSRKSLKRFRDQTRVTPLTAVVLAGICGFGLALFLKRRA